MGWGHVGWDVSNMVTGWRSVGPLLVSHPTAVVKGSQAGLGRVCVQEVAAAAAQGEGLKNSIDTRRMGWR